MPNSHQAKPEAWPHYRFEGGVQRGRDPQITISQAPGRRAAFQPLPAPTGKPPYHLSLDQVLPAQAVAAIQKAGQLVFHTAGDTGGVKTPEAQTIVAMKMVEQFAVTPPTNQPQFFYHLGDVIYYYGEAQNYYPQFYEPYIHYAAPILAIPGNHDGDVPKNSTEPSLAA